VATKTEPLTVSEAQRAIYIDFEGTAVDPPSLLGVAWFDDDKVRFVQYVVEEDLWPAAEAKSPDYGGDCRKATWTDLAEIRRRAETEHRRVFAWSTHEATALGKYVSNDGDREWFAANVENAIPYAKAWKKANHPDVVFKKDPKNPFLGKNRLNRYFGLIDYDVPKAFGAGNTAQRIRKVREMLNNKGGDYSALTVTKKGQWTKVLKHNWYDCDGLREIVLECAADLDVDTGP